MITIISPSPDDKRIYRLGGLRCGEVNRAKQVLPLASGKGVNAARALRCLHTETRLVLPAGRRFRESLALDDGLRGLFIDVVLVRERTRACITLVEDDGRTTEIVQEAAALSRVEAEEYLARCLDAIESASAVLLAGSLPPGLQEDFYTRCASSARDLGIPVVVDAHCDNLLQALRGEPTVVKITRAELAATLDLAVETLDTATACARLRELGARHVVLTDGMNPVEVYEEDGTRWTALPAAVIAVNATGSGDAMSAGVTLALLRGLNLRDAVAVGMRFGSANAASLVPGDLDSVVLDADGEMLSSLRRPVN